jgi:hypothetical protein
MFDPLENAWRLEIQRKRGEFHTPSRFLGKGGPSSGNSVERASVFSMRCLMLRLREH